jgi:hypothetical protein
MTGILASAGAGWTPLHEDLWITSASKTSHQVAAGDARS